MSLRKGDLTTSDFEVETILFSLQNTGILFGTLTVISVQVTQIAFEREAKGAELNMH
jgi:hypothetical protein